LIEANFWICIVVHVHLELLPYLLDSWDQIDRPILEKMGRGRGTVGRGGNLAGYLYRELA